MDGNSSSTKWDHSENTGVIETEAKLHGAQNSNILSPTSPERSSLGVLRMRNLDDTAATSVFGMSLTYLTVLDAWCATFRPLTDLPFFCLFRSFTPVNSKLFGSLILTSSMAQRTVRGLL